MHVHLTTQYCVNHPTTETLLHCYRCGKPICTRCATRTPVGLICRDCLTNQRAGYYNATALDYFLTVVVGLVLSFIGGLIAALVSGLWFVAIFLAPFAGGPHRRGHSLYDRPAARANTSRWLRAPRSSSAPCSTSGASQS